jgi:acyl carrier protein
MDEVAADTVAIIAKRVPADKRNLSMTDRLEDLNIDSFSAVEMIYDLEEKFDVELPYNSNDNRPDLQTVGDLVEAIKKLIGGRQ